MRSVLAAPAALLLLACAGTARADFTGTVATPGGLPVPGAEVGLRDAVGVSAAGARSDADGRYRIPATALAGHAGPFTVEASFADPCREPSAGDLVATAGPARNGAVHALVLDALPFCAASPGDLPAGRAPTGNAWPEAGRVLSPGGGLTVLRVLAPAGARGLRVSLGAGTVVGTSDDRAAVPVTAPAARHEGPLTLSYAVGGRRVERRLATLSSGPVAPPPAGAAGDLVLIVDTSGSMRRSDPGRRRGEAVRLVVELAERGDRLAAVGFDDDAREIFPRTAVDGEASRRRLVALARRGIREEGDTDYRSGLAAGLAALAAEPVAPAVPKAAILLTDGAHNAGDYDNLHLRYAFNGSGRPWPICVVRLGAGFSARATARLKRIARETGGTYAATPTDTELRRLFLRCRGPALDAPAVSAGSGSFRVGQTRR